VSERSESSGEMSEWLKEHAWKTIPAARADAQQTPPTQSRFNDFRNIDAGRGVLVNHRVHLGFEGVCDTVLTQNSKALRTMRADARPYASAALRQSFVEDADDVRIQHDHERARALQDQAHL
jgi:hypothetical protein